LDKKVRLGLDWCIKSLKIRFYFSKKQNCGKLLSKFRVFLVSLKF